ncbi:unnamed protein product [Didymodactylos carnosus]|uniref:Uncharacterized protein n=1 Tax=Didymodactylos carnosus TaxID=1234261 RepID=A0A814C342_9BILA|nr:unnamed protein product [Didymodactylos carnosus]CAF3712091.1 unnamed protein product [Didymodactylos carnosus]
MTFSQLQDELFGMIFWVYSGLAYLHKLTYTEVWARQSTFRDSLCQMKFDLAKSLLIKRGIKRSHVVVSLQVQRQTEEQQNQGYENDDEQQQL